MCCNFQVAQDIHGLFHKDAIFLTGSNMVGGIQACDMVIIRKALNDKNSDVNNFTSKSIVEPIRAALA